jgi:hypothetical protein
MSITITHLLLNIVAAQPLQTGWVGVGRVVELRAVVGMPISIPNRCSIAQATCWVCDTYRRDRDRWFTVPRFEDLAAVHGMPMVPWAVCAATVAVAIRIAKAVLAARRDARAMGAVPVVMAVPPRSMEATRTGK